MNSTPSASAADNPPAQNHGLRLSEYVGYALGDTASNLFFQTFNIFLTYYYVDVWGLAAASVSWMMLLVRFWDSVADPVMGIIADRTKTRWGRFRPYLLWMALPYGIAGYLIFANPALGPTGKLLYAYATYTLMLLAYTGVNVPYSSLLGVLSPSSQTRTVASSFRFVGAFGGGLLVSLLVRPLVKSLGAGDEVSGFQQTMALFAVLSVGLFWVTFFTTRERVKPPPGQVSSVRGEVGELVRNRPWMILLFAAAFSTTFIVMRSGSTLFYFKYVAGDDGTPILLGTLDRTTIFLSSGMAAIPKCRWPPSRGAPGCTTSRCRRSAIACASSAAAPSRTTAALPVATGKTVSERAMRVWIQETTASVCSAGPTLSIIRATCRV